jgi:carbamoyltransferase
MSLWAGLGGASRNACVALCTRDRILGICEQERITRVRAAGFNSTGLPDEALDELLRRSAQTRSAVTTVALAEPGPFPAAFEPLRLEHHFAHACSAFLPSPFDSATIVICDHESPQVSVWDGNGTTVTRVDWPWDGPGFADVYSQCAEALGFSAWGREQRMEALARLDPTRREDRAEQLFQLDVDRLRLASEWQSSVRSWTGADAPLDSTAGLAAALQTRIGDLLIGFLDEVRRRTPARTLLCVGGSLFSNSHFNARVKRCPSFDEVFVPINPGNAGLAVGIGLHVSDHARRPVTPFLGPSYTSEEIKATLDNCKLNYEWASEADAITIAVDALQRGRLVGWFDGPMEWGPRALGARSILASPFAPYVLENLNRFLKHRDRWRGYALSGLEPAVHEYFEGPKASPFMECDYAPRDRERFRCVLPGEHAQVRIQTAGQEAPPRFRALLKVFGDASGVPVLVNTSFNGFCEPIVCSPRDAVRVFFGTGVDLLVLGEFVIRK